MPLKKESLLLLPLFCATSLLAQFTQQGPKLVGSGYVNLTGANQLNGTAEGLGLALSSDGNTAIIGGPYDNGWMGAAWVFTRAGGVWSQQGTKLVAQGGIGTVQGQGISVAISSDGNTALVGASLDNNSTGSVYVWTRSSGIWTQQAQLIGTGASGSPPFFQGASVALSSDGTTALIGVPGDDDNGAAFVFTRANGVWTQQTKLSAMGVLGPGASIGFSVSLSADGNTAVLGGANDNDNAGAMWVFTRAGTTWTQQAKLVGNGAVGSAGQGYTVAVSGDGNTAASGGTFDDTNNGAVWIFTRVNGIWMQQGNKLVGKNAAGPAGQGTGLSLSNDGNTVIWGGPSDNGPYGAAWVFTRSNGAWVQYGDKFVGTGGIEPFEGSTNALSADGTTALVGGYNDNGLTGAAWAFTRPAPGTVATHFSLVAPSTGIVGSSFQFTVTAQDAGNITVPAYAGTIHFTSTDPSATLPADTTLSGGTGVFSATLKTAGSQTITATDTANGALSGVSNTITVPGAITHFRVTAPGAATAGSSFDLTVTALDANNTTVANYGGTIHFTSTDAAAMLPANTTLSGGTGTFSATLKTAGSQTITITDTANSAISGVSNAITVGTAGGSTATHFKVTAPGATVAGASFQFTVVAQDANNATVANYPGTIHFTSTDAAATLPANSTLSGGTGTFAATLNTAGSQTITATGTANSAISGISSAIAVGTTGGGTTVTHFGVTAPNSAAAGASFQLIVTALDANNATVTNYAGTIHFASSDPAATLPANTTLSSGAGAFSITLKTAGSQMVTVADTANAAISGVSNAIAVAAAITAPIDGTPAADTSAAPQPFVFRFSDSRGYADLDVVNVLINNVLDARNSCYLAYSRSSGVLYLVADDGATLLPLKLNGSGSVSNHQCAVLGVESSASGSGNVLTLTLNVMFLESSPGNKIVYLAARDLQGGNSGWQALGVWTMPGFPKNPAVAQFNPPRSAAPAGTPQNFTFLFEDSKGSGDLGVVNVLINNSPDGRSACYLAYSRPQATLYLVGDAGGPLVGGIGLGGTGTLSNSQCTVSSAGSSAAASLTILSLALNVTFTPSFRGNKVVYAAARDSNDSNTSGWVAMGTNTVQ